jgi:hypothetical protein
MITGSKMGEASIVFSFVVIFIDLAALA